MNTETKLLCAVCSSDILGCSVVKENRPNDGSVCDILNAFYQRAGSETEKCRSSFWNISFKATNRNVYNEYNEHELLILLLTKHYNLALFLKSTIGQNSFICFETSSSYSIVYLHEALRWTCFFLILCNFSFMANKKKRKFRFMLSKECLTDNGVLVDWTPTNWSIVVRSLGLPRRRQHSSTGPHWSVFFWRRLQEIGEGNIQ